MGGVACGGADHRAAAELLFNTWRSGNRDDGGGDYLSAEHIYRYYEKQRERGSTTFRCTKQMAEKLIERMNEKAKEHASMRTSGQEIARAADGARLRVQFFIYYVEDLYVAQFDALDRNGDGYIDVYECLRVKSRELERRGRRHTDGGCQRMTSAERSELLRAVYSVMKLDRGDGKVSFQEYVEGMLVREMQQSDEVYRRDEQAADRA
eukprot:TRINITY_DN19452_c0_g1_i1.p2 TRINITY_DN19452_c0_g1~~TRINITY_DN19452_c0_g1_i1.p2  ORF type:complete len:208 (+),score=68.93 TRINITY_DN19452_c0_g1_i1:86-709(+)